MTAPARADQIKAIHTLKSRAGISDEVYRAMLTREHVDSSKKLSVIQAEDFIVRLRGLPAKNPSVKPRVKGALDLRGPFAGKLRALWIVGYDCGVVRDRTDKALIAFLERQTGLSHPAFLQEPSDARRVIEALKKWLAREAGIDWTVEAGADSDIVQRVAVIRAQGNILGEHWPSDDVPDIDQQIERLSAQALDGLRAQLGRAIRKLKGPRP